MQVRYVLSQKRCPRVRKRAVLSHFEVTSTNKVRATNKKGRRTWRCDPILILADRSLQGCVRIDTDQAPFDHIASPD